MNTFHSPHAASLFSFSHNKVRQQLKTQGETLVLSPHFIPHPHCAAHRPAPGSKANAFWTVGVQMARSEGMLSLMNGLTASMLRELTYSGIRMGTYEYFKDACVQLCPTP